MRLLRRLLRRLLPVAAFLLAATPLAAQVVRGKVLDAATGAGVPEVAVRGRSADGHEVGRARTAADGSFRMQLRTAATVRIEAQRTGYQPTLTAELPVGLREAVEVEVRLSAAAVAIEPLRVTARVQPPRRRSLELNGFYDRERQGIGEYLRREDIERQPNQDLAHLLSRVPGAAILYQGSSQYIYFPRNGRPSISQSRRGPPRNACLPRLFLNGVRITYDGQSDINSSVSPEQIEAVEVFRGASEIPVQYNDNNS
ncbi:MAG TPA: TonB-dependent receptor, partial [Longimicrobium sp.]|nr:TonB-dependent receptor [Longimicrobium sp.]